VDTVCASASPTKGTPLGATEVGGDRLHVDFEQGQIVRAVELGLGAQRTQDVAIRTGDADGEKFAAEIRPLIP
jgi:hypothetical protein